MRDRGLGAIAVLIVSGAGLFTAWTSTGSDPGVTLWWLAVVLVGVLLPGWALVRSIRGGQASATDLGWSGPTGLALALATWLVAHLVGQSLPTLVVGPVVVGGLVLVPATRRRLLGGGRAPEGTNESSRSWPWMAWTSLVLVVLVAVRWLWVGGLATVAPKPTPDYELWYQDLLYQTALTGELRRSLVPSYPMVNGEPLGYHWFFHAIAAQLSGTGIDDLDIVTRLLPATLVVVLLLLGAAVGCQVTGHWTGGIGAAAALAFVRPVSTDTWLEPPITPIANYWQLSPTATLGWVFGLAVVGCLVAALRRAPDDTLAPAALLPVYAVGAAGAKSAQLPVILCGLGLAAVAGLTVAWRRRADDPGALRAAATRYAVCLGTLVVITVLAVRFIYPGSYGLRLDLSAWPTIQTSVIEGRPPLSTGIDAPAVVVAFLRRWAPVLLPALGLVVLVRRRPSDPAGWIGIGTLIGGVVAVLALWHPSGSQYYFAIAALPICYALSGAGVAAYLRSELTGRTEGTPAAGAVQWRRVLPVVAVGAAGVLVVLATRRLVQSHGKRPSVVAASAPHGDAQAAWAWFAPTLTAFAALALLVTVVWLARRRSARPLLRGTWAALLVVVVVAAGARSLWVALGLTTNPGPPTSAAAATDARHRPAVTPALFEAGQYLRRQASPGDVIATNRVWNGHLPSGPRDNRDFSVSALSGLRSDVAGYGYAPRVLESLVPGTSYILAPFWDQPRLDAELALVEKPTAERLAAAYRTRGVRWIVADERSGPVSADLLRLTDVVSRVDGVWLARLRPPTS